MEQYMHDLTKQQCFSPRAKATETARMSLCTALITGLVLSIIPLLTGCGDGETGGVAPSTPPVGVSASLAWQPAEDPSVIAYFVYYGRQSPGQRGSCSYEHSKHVTSPSVTVTNLEPDTLYYFTVSAYNGLESPCSDEISTVTDPLPV
jgi:hypothetical protein